ncbi:sigma-54-dependent Fis family transcriptional regulator [Burkholderia aenigmatica]|uniref:Fis family GAF modulated sigma54 specific transcriptional regulator n=4 Tax=Burkholderia TaxID=32008 RepID=A0A6J5IZP5_9BURK|nr:sigma-54-dependent Fis family transcriptional regulator [Burkholderia aenigmatica]UKD14530.1 sigma-54-dependent Fis family transcriptional regulator [Burkholderia aenigmatica]CAB3964797.1 Fis family GAF modulated sigma54 specific transcriptional regulator [Burkholderia aenigmatica]
MQDYFPSGQRLPDRLQTTRLIRERLSSDGVLPQGCLRIEIDQSWRRSLDHGVRWDDDARLNLHEFCNLDELHDANRLLLAAAAPELEFLAERCGRDGMILLADARATILSVDGDASQLAALGIGDIRAGASWCESLRGTNALGTALVEGRAVAIDSGEHFLGRLSRFSCRSLPLCDPHGKPIGVLDLTREGELPLTLDDMSMLMSAAATHIETRLFDVYFPEHVVLVFHPRHAYLGSSWSGVLAVSEDGRIVAASPHACDLLGTARDALVGRRCESAAVTRTPSFVAFAEQGGMLRVEGVDAAFHCKALRLPRATAVPALRGRGPAPAAAARNDAGAQALAALAGRQPRLLRALTMARQGLNNGLPVLVQGETGTGKEVVARALHDASARAGKPFVAVNCASIPEGLIESELFGYRDGAFTGARKGGMTGRLMQAHGGTLFLDEIGDMPLHLQARLLRVLQERKVAPLGAGDEQAIDIAVICATHRDLQTMVRDKSFREDLYYRIHGVNVLLPALRERDDVDLIVTALLARLGAPHVSVNAELADVFRQHRWPGNIRQLEMVLRTALAVRDEHDDVLGLDHLCDGFIDGVCPAPDASFGLIRRHEDDLIRESLARHDGNVAAAAQTLGISRATLYRRLKRLQS